MKLFQFTLRFDLPDTCKNTDELLNELYDGRGVVGVQSDGNGRVIVELNRKADLIRTAVISATRDVRSVIPGNYTIAVSYDDKG